MENHGNEVHIDIGDETVQETENGGLNDFVVGDENYRDDEQCIPILGMEFDTHEEAYEFYNLYARFTGFSVRKNHLSRRKIDGKVDNRGLCCSFEGKYCKKRTPIKKRRETRTGCLAMLEVRLNDEEKYSVTRFVEGHNHDLVDPSLAHTLRSHRKIDPSQAILIRKMYRAGIKGRQVMHYLRGEVGGAQNLNFLKSDADNFMMRARTEILKKGDGQCLLEYFMKKKEANRFFFYEIEMNEENEIWGCFWADAKSIRDYSFFGDVVCFDTTYNTNEYNMKCAPLIGVNNHNQTILFGCALLVQETTDSFAWLFKTFVKAMGGTHPRVIFTDQAIAIGNAIEDVFPNTHHRLCLWHINRNAQNQLSHVDPEFTELPCDFRCCMYEPESVDEFESMWEALLEKYQLGENEWLQSMYKLRKKWVLVYGRDQSCAGMTTTQRSESINFFFKQYFKRNMILRELVEQYNVAMADRLEEEKIENKRSRHSRANLYTEWDVEREASKIYTRKVFDMFQKEVIDMMNMKLTPKSDDGTTCSYIVSRLGKNNRGRSLTYAPSEKLVSCSCKKFELSGYLCAHSLKLFRELEFSSLPPRYYLKRWSMDATEGIVYDSHGDVIVVDLDPMSTARYSEMSHIAQTIVSKASLSLELSSSTTAELMQIMMKVNSSSISQNNANDASGGNSNEGGNVPNVTIQAPKRKRGKNQAKGKMNDGLEENPNGSNALSKKRRLSKATNQKESRKEMELKINTPLSRMESTEGVIGLSNQVLYGPGAYPNLNAMVYPFYPFPHPNFQGMIGMQNQVLHACGQVPVGNINPAMTHIPSTQSFQAPVMQIEEQHGIARRLDFSNPWCI